MSAYDALELSDLHFGLLACRARAALTLLRGVEDGSLAKHAYINGDLFDARDVWLSPQQQAALALVIKLIAEKKLTLIRGNHDPDDSWIRSVLGVEMEPYVLLDHVAIVHGHQGDETIVEHPFLTDCADFAYRNLQYLNLGLAETAKGLVKTLTDCDIAVETWTTRFAQEHGKPAVIAGHTHDAVDGKLVHGVRYYNSGCWTKRQCSWVSIAGADIRLHYVDGGTEQ